MKAVTDIRQERAASQSSKNSDNSDHADRKLTSVETDPSSDMHEFITHPVVDLTNMYVLVPSSLRSHLRLDIHAAGNGVSYCSSETNAFLMVIYINIEIARGC